MGWPSQLNEFLRLAGPVGPIVLVAGGVAAMVSLWLAAIEAVNRFRVRMLTLAKSAWRTDVLAMQKLRGGRQLKADRNAVFALLAQNDMDGLRRLVDQRAIESLDLQFLVERILARRSGEV